MIAMTLHLRPETAGVLAALAHTWGLSVEDYLQELVERERSAETAPAALTLFERGLGLFGSPEDTALLDEVVSIAYQARRRPRVDFEVAELSVATGAILSPLTIPN
jgi:hypothetical protein